MADIVQTIYNSLLVCDPSWFDVCVCKSFRGWCVHTREQPTEHCTLHVDHSINALKDA